MKTIIFTINGTHCKACKSLIEDVSKDIKGVELCHVDFLTGKTIIEYNENFDLDLFIKEIEGLGQYKIEINQQNI